MQPIFDASGNIKYYINETPSETQVLTPTGAVVYKYIKATNQTLDANGNLVLIGNVVLSLK